jgi:ethanolamine utilization protein EutN
MKIAKVVGNIVATRKDERLVGKKILVVQLLVPDTKGELEPVSTPDGFCVAVDLIGSGVGEHVIICTGSSARIAAGNSDAPIDSVIVGHIDTVDIDTRYCER